MKGKKRIGMILGLALVGIIIVVLVRTFLFASKQEYFPKAEHVKIDETGALERLSKAIQIKTITYDDPAKRNNKNFIDLQDYIEAQYPNIRKTLNRTIINNYSLLYEWKGSDTTQKPVILTAHMDVVPEGEETWEVDPYGGLIKDGYVWGRGTLDDKGSMFSILEAAEFLIQSGYTPQRTIYFGFGHDEEAGTPGGMNGAGKIAEYLKGKGIHAISILDEGGQIIDEKMSLVKGRKFALIAVAEKGFLTLKITAPGQSGHSMMPPRQTAVARLAKAIVKLDNHKTKSSINGTIGLSFDYFGPEMPFGQKLLFANRWLFGGLIKARMEADPLTAAMIRTTVAPTMLQAGTKEQSLPATASVIVNFRIIPGETSKDVIQHVKDSISDPGIKVEQYGTVVHEPIPVAGLGSQGYKVLTKTIREVFPDVMTAPSLNTGRTDSLYYKDVADNIYRFAPYLYTPGDDKRPHGLNERIKMDNYLDMIQFYIRYIENCSKIISE